MPELPELEIVAGLLEEAIRGAQVESVSAPGINAVKTFEPPLSALEGRTLQGMRRRGKHLILDLDGDLALLIHLMSAGRLQLYDRRAGPRDRTSRVLMLLRPPARDAGTASDSQELELRLREFGSKQSAWVKLLSKARLEGDPALAGLGPDAWPDTPELSGIAAASRPLNSLLRDQRVIAGIGRSWADEILWKARLSPFRRFGDLDAAQLGALRAALFTVLDDAISHYRRELQLPIPDRLPMPLRIHRREGEPCPRCATTLRGVHFDEHVIAYCPDCQTGGRILKDRRLSRLLR